MPYNSSPVLRAGIDEIRALADDLPKLQEYDKSLDDCRIASSPELEGKLADASGELNNLATALDKIQVEIQGKLDNELKNWKGLASVEAKNKLSATIAECGIAELATAEMRTFPTPYNLIYSYDENSSSSNSQLPPPGIGYRIGQELSGYYSSQGHADFGEIFDSLQRALTEIGFSLNWQARLSALTPQEIHEQVNLYETCAGIASDPSHPLSLGEWATLMRSARGVGVSLFHPSHTSGWSGDFPETPDVSRLERLLECHLTAVYLLYQLSASDRELTARLRKFRAEVTDPSKNWFDKRQAFSALVARNEEFIRQSGQDDRDPMRNNLLSNSLLKDQHFAHVEDMEGYGSESVRRIDNAGSPQPIDEAGVQQKYAEDPKLQQRMEVFATDVRDQALAEYLANGGNPVHKTQSQNLRELDEYSGFADKYSSTQSVPAATVDVTVEKSASGDPVVDVNRHLDLDTYSAGNWAHGEANLPAPPPTSPDQSVADITNKTRERGSY